MTSEVFKKRGLTQQQLDVPISFKHCREFSEKLAEWESLAPRLYLTDTDIATIKHDHQLNLRSQCSACLTKWQDKFGSQATFLNLAQALEGSVDRIEKLCEYFKTISGSENEVGVNGRETEISVRLAEEDETNAETRASEAEKRAKIVEEQWLVERKQINIIEEKVLHEGQWGDIKVAQFEYTKVAAKSFNLSHLKQPVSSQPAQNKWYRKFISDMNIIASFRHPNLVLFLGACVDHEAIIVLTELMHTSLKQQLLRKNVSFTEKQVITISLDVARALHYLHYRGVVHDNITSDHILLEPLADQKWKAKVIDSGLHNLRKVLLPDFRPMYVSPSKLSTTKTDVYSFAVVLLEMMCKDIYDFGMVVSEMCTIQTASNSIKDQRLRRLVINCTQEARKNRPSADKIIIELEQHNKD